MPTETLKAGTKRHDIQQIINDHRDASQWLTINIERGATLAPFKANRSRVEVASFGSTAAPRPLMKHQSGDKDNAVTFDRVDGFVLSGIAIDGYHIGVSLEDRTTEQGHTGILIEDCHIRNTWGGRGQGIYGHRVDDYELSHCCFENCGGFNEAEAHPVYMTGTCGHGKVYDCLFVSHSEGGANGMRDAGQYGGGATIERNVVLGTWGGFEPVRLKSRTTKPVIARLRHNRLWGQYRYAFWVGWMEELELIGNVVLDPQPIVGEYASQRREVFTHGYDGKDELFNRQVRFTNQGNFSRGYNAVHDARLRFENMGTTRILIRSPMIRDLAGQYAAGLLTVGDIAINALGFPLPFPAPTPPPAPPADDPIIVPPPPDDEPTPTPDPDIITALHATVAQLKAQVTEQARREAEDAQTMIELNNHIAGLNTLVNERDMRVSDLMHAIDQAHAILDGRR